MSLFSSVLGGHFSPFVALPYKFLWHFFTDFTTCWICILSHCVVHTMHLHTNTHTHPPPSTSSKVVNVVQQDFSMICHYNNCCMFWYFLNFSLNVHLFFFVFSFNIGIILHVWVPSTVDTHLCCTSAKHLIGFCVIWKSVSFTWVNNKNRP